MSSINNITPLETFREIIGYHPYHFWGQSASDVAGLSVTSKCNSIVSEKGWQNADAAGRDDIRRAIATAEARLFEYLGYRVGESYVTKLLQYPRPRDARMQYGAPIDAQGRWLPVNVGEGYIQEIGTETFTTIAATQAVVYSDSYGDGANDTFTLTVNMAALSPQPTADEIAVYFNAVDRLDSGGRVARWRIEPVNISITGTTATITGRSWLLTRPIKFMGLVTNDIDPNDTTLATNNFAQTVDVARRYTSSVGTTTATSQAMLIWETDPPHWACGCSGTGLTYSTNATDPAAQAYAIARAGIRDARRGEIAPGEVVYSATNDEFTSKAWGACRQPDRVVIRYKAGAKKREIESQLVGGGRWDEIVTAFAAAELNRRICACDTANRELFRWQIDLARTGGNNDLSYGAISPSQLNNPFGTRRGQVYAWQQVKNLKITLSNLV